MKEEKEKRQIGEEEKQEIKKNNWSRTERRLTLNWKSHKKCQKMQQKDIKVVLFKE